MVKISRRDFLKAGSAGVALVAAGEVLGGVVAAERIGPGGKSVSRTTGRPREAIPSTCQLCPARCGILGFVEEGRLVKIEGNPKHPNNRGRICAKGQAGLNILYDPDRLLYPLRRAGARGEGKWERISWEEALDLVAGKLRELREQGRPEQFVFLAGTAATERFVTRFLRAYGTPNGLNRMPHGDDNKAAALNLTWGAPVEVNDAAHAKYLLNFGANPYEAHLFHLPLVQRIIEGRRGNGAKLVTFDVRLSHTAGKSDEWFPIRPGTDGIVALALANVIMEAGLHDRQFIDEWTTISSGALRQYLSQYAPERAEEISGVPAADIRRIALEFARSKPATTISGTGLTMHYNGVQNERCVALLNAITGNVDVRGGYCLPRSYSLLEPEPRPEPPALSTPLSHPAEYPFGPHLPVHAAMAAVRAGSQPVGVLMTYMHNPAYSNPDNGLSAEVLLDEGLVPFHVAVDTHLSESSALADVILPDTTYLERWDVESGPSFEMVPFVALRQPVVKPRGEALPFHDVLRYLAQRIGGGMERYFGYGSAQGYLRAAVAHLDGLAAAGGWELLRRQGVWYDAEARPLYGSYRNGGFNTPSGKFEIYSRALEERGFPALPSYEAIPDHAELSQEVLVLTTFKPNVLTSANANNKWVSEIIHDNPAWMHPEMATALGVKSGDTVTITSSRGSLTTRVRLSQGIHPRAIAVSGGSGHWALGGVAQAKPFKSDDPDTQILWWGRHGNGVCPNSVIPHVAAVVGGGQAWHDTPVKVAKV